MGAFTSEALGGYQYVIKISGEYTKLTEIHPLMFKRDEFCWFQAFV